MARYLLEKNKKVAILSRGYGGNNPLQKTMTMLMMNVSS
jgi:tetraacyldisaccharide-1-P 4'-kinase